jgi:hypothetical protein
MYRSAASRNFSSFPPKKLNPPDAPARALSACVGHRQYQLFYICDVYLKGGVYGGHSKGGVAFTFARRALGSPDMMTVLSFS